VVTAVATAALSAVVTIVVTAALSAGATQKPGLVSVTVVVTVNVTVGPGIIMVVPAADEDSVGPQRRVDDEVVLVEVRENDRCHEIVCVDGYGETE